MGHLTASFLFAIFHFSYVHGQFLNCNWVASLDCVRYTKAETCASDGKTYINRCYFAKAQCVDHKLHAVRDGSCQSGGLSVTQPTTTPSTTTHRTTQRATTTPKTHQPTNDPLHVLCEAMAHAHCASDVEPVCGSNDRTYINTCEFHKDVCQHHDLTVKHVGFC